MTSVRFSLDFPSSLSSCWAITEKKSLYSSVEEFQRLIKEVLSWDIRSLSRRTRPHHVTVEHENDGGMALLENEITDGDELDQDLNLQSSRTSLSDITCHLILEGVNISYGIDNDSNITVLKATLPSDAKNSSE